jgi:hypothetical protein
MNTPLKTSILSKIRDEHIVPVPKSHFRNQRWFLWAGIVSVLAFSTVFGVFFIDDSLDFFRFGRGGNGGQLLFFPPVFWGIFLAGLMAIGLFGFRKTAVGYRYDVFRNAIVWGIAVLLAAVAFRGTGLGPAVHSYVAGNIPFLADIVYRESSWNEPENGRLSGTIQGVGPEGISLRDLDGNLWKIDISGAHIGKMAKTET